jgi:hypothetical protein
MIRAKFKVTDRTEHPHTSNDGSHSWSVNLMPVTSGSEENKKFYSYTPGGSMSLSGINGSCAAQLIPGTEVYIDITPIISG